MTISLAWIRKVKKVEELVVATDSRLSFGCRWDCCPKLISLPRNDSIVCFAGDTMYAYPIMLQIQAAVAQHPRLLSRSIDITDLKGHLIRILNGMAELIHDLPVGVNNEPDTTFLVAGWSWKLNQYSSWLLHYDAHIKKFTYKPTRSWTEKRKGKRRGKTNTKFLSITGDYKDEYKAKLVELLRKKGKLEKGGFDMEPLEVLIDMLKDNSFDKIGGAPQITKIYKYANTRPFGIFWPSRDSGNVSLNGRPLLDYELSQYHVYDPDTFEIVKHTDLANKN